MIQKINICILVVLLLGVVSSQDPLEKAECHCQNKKGTFYNPSSDTCSTPPHYFFQDSCIYYHRWYQTYVGYKYHCVKCEEPFALDLVSGRCVAQKNCLKYNSNIHQCEECREGYYLNASKQVCQPNPQQGSGGYTYGCKAYELHNSQLVCTQCSQVGYVAKNQRCISSSLVIPNCEIAENLENCLVCSEGYSPNSDGCYKNPQESDPVYIENCQIYQFRSYPVECSACKEGYAYDSQKNVCQKIKNVVENCLNYVYDKASQEYYCRDCISDFYIPAGEDQCLKCPHYQEKGFLSF